MSGRGRSYPGWVPKRTPEAVREVTRRYGIYFKKNRDGGVNHTQLTTIIGGEGMMRAQYPGTRFDEDFERDLLSLVRPP